MRAFWNFLKIVGILAGPMAAGLIISIAADDISWFLGFAALELLVVVILLAMLPRRHRENYSDGLTYEEYVEKYGKPKDRD